MALTHSPQELAATAKNIRRTIVNLIYGAKSSHIGCSLSAADILTTLYFEVMRIDPKNPTAEDRDRFVLSKGHSVSAVYATLAIRGFFPESEIQSYGQNGTKLASHIVRGVLPGTETSNGSGGHGQSLGAGMAVALKRQGKGARVFVLSGDGETEEGSAWEAFMFAAQHNLNNLTVIIDRNNLQDGVDGKTVSDILNLEPLDEKLKAFGWEVDTVDGHNFEALESVLNKKTEKPHAVIAKTIKGRGVSYMENRGEWHGKCPNDEEFAIAIKELS